MKLIVSVLPYLKTPHILQLQHISFILDNGLSISFIPPKAGIPCGLRSLLVSFPNYNSFSGSILEKPACSSWEKGKAHPRGQFAPEREHGLFLIENLLPTALQHSFQHAMCPQMPSHHVRWQTIMSLASTFKNSIAVGCIIFGAQN